MSQVWISSIANAFDIITMYNKYRLLYGRDVPLGHIGTEVVATPVPIWPKGTHRQLPFYYIHVNTFNVSIISVGFFIPGAPVRQKKWRDKNSNNIERDIDQ